MECILADTAHGGGYRDAFQRTAPVKRTLADADHRRWDRNAGHRCLVHPPKRAISLQLPTRNGHSPFGDGKVHTVHGRQCSHCFFLRCQLLRSRNGEHWHPMINTRSHKTVSDTCVRNLRGRGCGCCVHGRVRVRASQQRLSRARRTLVCIYLCTYSRWVSCTRKGF